MRFLRTCGFIGAVVLVVGCTAAPVDEPREPTSEPPATETTKEHTPESLVTELPMETRQLIDDVRGSTAHLRDLVTAKDAGYGKFLECFRHGDDLGMGQHYVNGNLVDDDDLDPSQPEGLVYEPRDDGSMVLVALEYIVFEEKWDPTDTGRKPPEMFGQTFSLKTNIPIAQRPTQGQASGPTKYDQPHMPALYVLHMWLWAHNPEGLFAAYNPLVSCPSGALSIDLAAASAQ